MTFPLERKHILFEAYKVPAITITHQVMTDTTFSIFLSSSSTYLWRLLQNTVEALSVRSPISLVSLSDTGSQVLCVTIDIFLTIPNDTTTAERHVSLHSVQDSPSSEREHWSRSTHNALRK